MKRMLQALWVALAVWTMTSGLLYGLEGKRVVIVAANFPPSSGKDLPYHGFMAHLVTEAFKREGYTVNYAFYPWTRALDMAKAGLADGLLSASYTEERAQFFLYTHRIHQMKYHFITRRDKPMPYGSLDDLNHYTIGVIRGSISAIRLRSDGIRIEEVANWDQNLKKLLTGRVDSVLGNTLNILHILKTEFPSGDQAKLMVVTPPYFLDDTYVAFSRARPGASLLVDICNRGIQNMKSDGAYQAILTVHDIPE